ncbi:MAG: response regulator [Cyanobacteriota bacterium]|nr:response regulator [Cyanobacteriota bacterium]
MTPSSVDSDPRSSTSSTKAQASAYRVLQEMSTRGISGCLTIQDTEDPAVGWQIYMTADRLSYATSASGKGERLPYLMQRFLPQIALSELDVTSDPSKSEYEDLCRWCRSGKFPLDELRRLLLRSSQDALSQALAISKGSLQFNKGVQPDPIVLSVPSKEVVVSVRGTSRRWEQMRPLIPSSFSRVELDGQRLDQFCEYWERSQANSDPSLAPFLRTQQMSTGIRLFTQGSTLYAAAVALQTDPLTLASWLHPLIQSGGAAVQPYRKPQKATVIACIDDSKTVQRQVQLTLQMAGYEVLSITEPAQALTALVRNRPAVILMDVNMPEIDGYELSRMLRQSKQLREIPIVMLTGRDGLLDRLRAQLLGVTEYLTKPFDPATLLEAIQKLASPISSEL